MQPWQPLWIGNEARRLYAAFHPGARHDARIGLLIVPPLFHEQLRSRRLLTEIAVRLAASGIPCLRFDYYGSGDSEGGGEEMDFGSMRDDVEVAADALRSMAGVDRLGALAVRAGMLPLASWLGAGGDAQCVVMWEPIVDGPGWLAELERDDARELRSSSRYPLRRGVPVERSERQLMGFDVSPRLRGELASAQVAPDAWDSRPGVLGVLHPGVTLPSLRLQRIFELPADAPRIGGSTRMDGALFLAPGLHPVVDALGAALGEAAQSGRPVQGTAAP